MRDSPVDLSSVLTLKEPRHRLSRLGLRVEEIIV
jgi:hypothetical protein